MSPAKLSEVKPVRPTCMNPRRLSGPEQKPEFSREGIEGMEVMILLVRSESGEFFAIGAIPNAKKAVFPASDHGYAIGCAGGGLHEVRKLGDGANLGAVVIDYSNEILLVAPINCREVTSLVQPMIFFFRSPRIISQELTTPSAPAVARTRPSARNATLVT